jgi:hypothetical protein
MASSLTGFENIAVDFSNHEHEDPEGRESFIQRLVDASFIGPECDYPMDSVEDNLHRHILNCQAALALILDNRKLVEVKSRTDKQHQYLLAVSNISQVLLNKMHFFLLAVSFLLQKDVRKMNPVLNFEPAIL